jgi:hypothetical protein
MNKLEHIDKISKLVTPTLLNCLIYNDDDSYVLFEKYKIFKTKGVFVVYRHRDEREFTFNKIKNATVWAILDKHDKFYEANRVLELDLLLESINVDKAIHQRLKKNLKSDYLLYSVKYEQDLIRQNKFQHELNKYITVAKICQERGFQNELNRPSGKQKEQVGYQSIA